MRVSYTGLLVHVIASATAVSISIRTDLSAFPFVSELSGGRTFAWSKGRVAEYLSSSRATVLCDRGVRFVHRSFDVCLSESLSFSTVLCERTNHSLCNTYEGLPVFPESTAGANVVFGGNDKCTESFTGRTMQLSGRTSITLCDILSGSQRIFFTESGQIHVGDAIVGPITQLLVSLIGVGLVGGVVFRFTGGGAHVAGGGICTFLCLCSILLVVFLGDPWTLYTTEQDRMCFLFLVSYCVYNLGRWIVCHYNDPQHHPPYSLSVGALNLLSFRLFATCDNPCSPFIMLFLLIRVLQQLQKQSYAQSLVACVSLYLDCTLLSFLINFGFIPQYDSELKALVHLMLATTVSIMLFFG